MLLTVTPKVATPGILQSVISRPVISRPVTSRSVISRPEVLSAAKSFRDENDYESNQEQIGELDGIAAQVQNGELASDPHGSPSREPIRHLLYGSPEAVRRTILLLHQLGYAEPGLWSRLQPTSTPGQVMSLLVRYLRLE